MNGPEKKKRPPPAFLFGKPRKGAEPQESPEEREAREAREAEAARIEAAEAARIAEIGAAWAQVGERIRAALPSSADYRQIYFLSLLRQGRTAQEQGRAGVAAHCRRCIDNGLATLSASAAQTGVAPAKAGAPAADPSPLHALESRWNAAARARAATLLERHAQRLSPAEREAYAASLEASQARSAQPLRRKLVERLLRAESYRRRGARFSGWTKTRVSEVAPAGPYNDFIALEQTVQRIAAAHPEWAAEFLDLYGEMGKIRSAYASLLPMGKK